MNVEFYQCPRLLTPGKPFVGARLLCADGSVLRANELCGVGYTRAQAVNELKQECARFLTGLDKGEALAACARAYKACGMDKGASPDQDWVHRAAQATYLPRHRKGNR